MAMIGDGHWKSFNIVEDIANIVGRSVNQITEYTVRVHFTLMYTLQVLPNCIIVTMDTITDHTRMERKVNFRVMGREGETLSR